MSSSTNIVIHAKNITKRYSLFDKPLQRLKAILFNDLKSTVQVKQFTALDNISFSVHKGDTVGIIGENGSGKSTLLQIICSIITADEGYIEINGRIAALLELGAGFNPEFTGKENIFMNAAILGLSEQEIADKYQDIVNFAEIDQFIDHPVKTYSSGMYIRLAFAVAINSQPDILIIDEALAVGDARFQSKCFNKIKEIKKKGATILFVSHDISSVRQFCDQVIWLEKGRTKMAGDVLEVTSKYMEYLFQTPESEALTLTSNSLIEDDKAIDNDDIKPEISANLSSLSDDNSERNKPINHWGNQKGSILSCSLMDSLGRQKKLFKDDEIIEIELVFKLPVNVNYEGFGIAFAIRALNGSDLIVYDTFGQSIKFNPNQQRYEVKFAFANPLNEGKYMLVAVLEDRSSMVPSYYEFIEGIEYFSVIQSKKFFGLFVPSVKCVVNCEQMVT